MLKRLIKKRVKKEFESLIRGEWRCWWCVMFLAAGAALEQAATQPLVSSDGVGGWLSLHGCKTSRGGSRLLHWKHEHPGFIITLCSSQRAMSGSAQFVVEVMGEMVFGGGGRGVCCGLRSAMGRGRPKNLGSEAWLHPEEWRISWTGVWWAGWSCWKTTIWPPKPQPCINKGTEGKWECTFIYIQTWESAHFKYFCMWTTCNMWLYV